MVAHDQRRANGMTGGDEIAMEEGKALTEPIDEDGELGLTGGALDHPEDLHSTLAPAFRRMRTDWNSPDRNVVDQMKRAVDSMIMERFSDLFDMYLEIWLLVREPEVDPETSQLLTEDDGTPRWKRAPSGFYVEDWDRITSRERERFLYQLITNLVRWKSKAVDLWGEALFARAQFEEAFSNGYRADPNPRLTIEDRTAEARTLAAEYRYRAVYLSYLSKRADALVSSVEALSQRLKDIHVA